MAVVTEKRLAALVILQNWGRHAINMRRAREERKQRQLAAKRREAANAIQGVFRGHNARLELR